MSIKSKIERLLFGDMNSRIIRQFKKKYEKYSFEEGYCQEKEQFEAAITRIYHTIEKGLAYNDFRPGLGKDKIEMLITELEKYTMSFGCDAFFYETALSVLKRYVEKNEAYNFDVQGIKQRIALLPGTANRCGGEMSFLVPLEDDIKRMTYKELIENRHSIRHFSNKPVDIERIVHALNIAQHTPSACNRQGWKTRIITDKKKLGAVLNNQNGNRGFGEEIDKLIVVSADLRFFNHDREMFQAYIDGGMYALGLINSLYYEGIGSIPLSASLSLQQEQNVRQLINMHDAEVFIMFIGVGNYPVEGALNRYCQTTKSERKPVETIII